MSLKSNDVDALLAEKSPEVRAKIYQALFARRYDPNDPLFDLLRVWKAAEDASAQTVVASDRACARIGALISQIESQFENGVTDLHAASREVAKEVRHQIIDIIPGLQAQVRSVATATIDQMRAEQMQRLGHEMQAALVHTLNTVAQHTHERASAESAGSRLRFHILAVAWTTGLLLIGLLGGYGVAIVRPPAAVAQYVDYGKTYEKMYPHMPRQIKAWVQSWTSHQ